MDGDDSVTAGERCGELLESIRQATVGLDSVRAIQLCDQAAEECPESPEAWAVYGYHRTWQGRRSEAHAAIDRALTLNPNSAMAWAAKAFLAGFEAQGDEAVEYAKRALDLDGENPWVISWCIDAYCSEGDTETCLEMAKRWYQAHPDDLRAVNHYCSSLRASGQADEAFALADDAEKRFPGAPSLILRRARKLKAARQLTAAIEVLRAAIKETPGSAALLAELAGNLSRINGDDEAEELALRALDICPVSLLAMQAMQNVHTHRGDRKKAREWRERAMEAVPLLRAQSSLSEATAASRRGDWKTVLRVTEPVLSSHLRTTRQTANFFKARALLALERYDEAGEPVDALAEIDPHHHCVYEYRARMSRAAGRLDEAAATLRNGVARFPTDGTLRALLLRVLHDKGAENDQKALIEEVRANPPDFPAGFSQVYRALMDTEHPLIAHEILRIGRERFPDSPELKLLEALGKLTSDDPAGARRAASDVTGEFQDAAGKLKKAAEFIEQMKQLRNRILGTRNNDKPGSIN